MVNHLPDDALRAHTWRDNRGTLHHGSPDDLPTEKTTWPTDLADLRRDLDHMRADVDRIATDLATLTHRTTRSTP